MGCLKLTYEPLLKPVYRAGVAGVTREAGLSRQNPWETVDTGNFYYVRSEGECVVERGSLGE